MDGNFSRYETTSAGDIVSLAGLIGRTPFACTNRYGFCQSRASVTERYLLGSGGGMRFLSGDSPVSATFCILAGCEQDPNAIAAHRKAGSRLRAMHRILA